MVDPKQPSGAAPRALFPRAWKYYDGFVATSGLLLILANTLMGLNVFSDTASRWINVGVALLVAVMIWARNRGGELGVIKTGADHLQPPPPSPPAPPPAPS
jgi:hypothetical protein